MSMEIVPYSSKWEPRWDRFCSDAVNATFLHTRRFLGYHGDRFKDLSTLLVEKGEWVGLFPAAEAPGQKNLVVSHPGATYGGIVHAGKLTGTRMIEALTALRKHYSKKDYRKLLYKMIPHIYTQASAQDDSYSLFRLGAVRVRCDLSCAIDLSHQRVPSERRRRALKKAMKSVTLSNDMGLLSRLWDVIEGNLGRKYGAKPVHTLGQLKRIHDLFPERVLIRCALVEGKVEAGIVFFNSPMVWHTQYIAASERGYGVSALDAVVDEAIGEARQAGSRYFDFGTSNGNEGWELNDGLYRFKQEFGGGGVAHEFYELDLLS